MNALTAPMSGTERRDVGGAPTDRSGARRAGDRRRTRPPPYRWTQNVQPLVGADACGHAHVGFLAQGRIQGRYTDGCTFEYIAPQVMQIEPGHDAWVVGGEAAVLIEFDFERDTVARLGLRWRHEHGA